MKRTVQTIILFLISAFVCCGQGPQQYTPIKELIQKSNHQTFCIKAHFAGIHDSSNLTFFVEEDDYIIPVRLQKKDLGAEKRFLARELKDGDTIIVKGVLDDIDVDSESYKGLVDAIILDEKDALEQEGSDTSEEAETPLILPEIKPSFNGGDANEFTKWVNSQKKYPEEAKKNGIEGRVTLQFTVEADGSVTNVKVLRGVDESLDKEAVRVVSGSPRWSPGYAKGKPIKVTYTFPVIFKLD